MLSLSNDARKLCFFHIKKDEKEFCMCDNGLRYCESSQKMCVNFKVDYDVEYELAELPEDIIRIKRIDIEAAGYKTK